MRLSLAEAQHHLDISLSSAPSRQARYIHLCGMDTHSNNIKLMEHYISHALYLPAILRCIITEADNTNCFTNRQNVGFSRTIRDVIAAGLRLRIDYITSLE
jgi:hypothetical protein